MRNRADKEIIKKTKALLDNGYIRQVLADHLQVKEASEVADYIIDLIVRTTRW